MFEFPFTPRCAAHFEGVQRSRHVARRLKKLAKIAAILHKAGWPVWLSVGGLCFEPVCVAGEDDCKHCFFLRTAERLADLGVEEPFQPFCGPTLQDMLDEEDMMPYVGTTGDGGIHEPSSN